MEMNWETIVKDIEEINEMIQNLQLNLTSLAQSFGLLTAPGQKTIDEFYQLEQESE